MKRAGFWFLLVAMVMALGLAGCTPRATPTPAAPPPPSPPSPAVITQPAQPSPGEAAWQKVVEAAKKEGTVVSFSSGAVSGEEAATIARAFREKYGITVEFISGTPGAQMERAKTEFAAGKSVTDWMIQSQITFLNVIKDGLLQPWGEMPALAEKDVWIFPPQYDPEGYIISYGKYWFVPYINSQLVKPQDEPRSYLDFLKPQWTGKLNIIDPSGGVAPMILYASLKHYKGLDPDDLFRQLAKQKLRIATSYSEQATQVAQGLVHGAFLIQESYINRFLAEGAPVKPVYMTEGVPLRNLNALGLLKNAPHPNAARLLINWLLTREGQTVFAKAKNTSPSRKDVEDYSLVSKIITPQAKVYFVQNKELDLESARVQREDVISRLIGLK